MGWVAHVRRGAVSRGLGDFMHDLAVSGRTSAVQKLAVRTRTECAQSSALSWRRLPGVLASTLLALSLWSCSRADLMNQYDPASGASKKDYEGLVGRRGPDPAMNEGGEPPIPDFQSVLAAPAAPELADTRRVSIAVTETVPLRDILIELARRAEVDLELDPRIAGGIIMTATDRPFIEVIDRISDLAELRYRFDRNVLKVEIDDPYLEQYRMDVLNQTRSATGSVTSSTDASSAAQAVGTGGGGGANNTSQSAITMSSSSNFWGDIGTSISQILTSIQSRRGDAARDIRATFTPEPEVAAPAASAPAPAAPGMAQPGRAAAAAGGAAGAAAAGAGAGAAAAPTAPAAAPTLTAADGGGGGSVGAGNFTINPQAGLITVFATQRQQRLIEKYLRTVREQINMQVLIEAKVLEIALDDQYRAGINWQAFIGPGFTNAAGARVENFEINTNFTRSVVPADFTNPTVTGVFRNAEQDLNLAAQLVKAFGSVRTLSSPRLTVTNNQAAVLKVARNQVFFDLEAQREQSTIAGRGDTVTIESEIKSVPVGLIMSVQPAIDPVTRRISLSLRPSLTRITGFVSDPGVAITVAQINANGNSGVNVSSQIPIIEVREMDSVVAMSSGETVVMGGLMQESAENSREGLPGVMDLPVVGQAVSQNIRSNKVTELVIFLRATIISGNDSVAPEDIRLYKTFTPDPRPLAF